jgi:hypothetical protein
LRRRPSRIRGAAKIQPTARGRGLNCYFRARTLHVGATLPRHLGDTDHDRINMQAA